METAAAKIGWIFFYTFGGVATLLTIPEKIFSLLGIPVTANYHLNEPYQTVVSWLAIISMVVFIVRSSIKAMEGWEIRRHRKISNDERVYQLKKLHENEQKALSNETIK